MTQSVLPSASAPVAKSSSPLSIDLFRPRLGALVSGVDPAVLAQTVSPPSAGRFCAWRMVALGAVNTFEVSRLKDYLLTDYYGRFPKEGGEQRLADARAKHPPLEVPVIATHPETGRKVINVNEGHTSHIKNLSRVAANSILTLLFDLIKTPELQARFKWKPGSVAVWDNRQVQHYGVNDYDGQFRKLHRLTIRTAQVS